MKKIIIKRNQLLEMKKVKVKILSLFILIFVLIFFLSFNQKNEQNEELKININNITTNDFIYNVKTCSISDIFVVINMVFNNSEFPLNELNQMYNDILLKYNKLFYEEYSKFKEFFINYLISKKKFYDFDKNKLDQDEYIKQRFLVILYNPQFIDSLYYNEKIAEEIKAKYNTLNLSNNKQIDQLNDYLIDMVNKIKNIDEIDLFCLKVKNYINEKMFKYEISNYINKYINLFKIKDINKIDLSILFMNNIAIPRDPSIIFILLNPDINKYNHPYGIFNYPLGTLNIPSIYLRTESLNYFEDFFYLFFHEFSHYLQSKRNNIEIIFPDSVLYDKDLLIYPLSLFPDNILDISQLNKMMMHLFKDSNEILYLQELDAFLISAYAVKYLDIKFFEDLTNKIFDKKFESNKKRYLKNSFFLFLLYEYLNFANKNNLTKIFSVYCTEKEMQFFYKNQRSFLKYLYDNNIYYLSKIYHFFKNIYLYENY